MNVEPTSFFSVRDYGAVGDGVAADTAAIQAAVDACAEAGGGIVFVPAGVYRISTLELRDNVTLHLAAEATLLGSLDRADYGLASVQDTQARHLSHCLIYAKGARNIALTGHGTIDGQGTAFPCMSRQDSVPAFRGEVKRKPDERRSYFRPLLVIFVDCENVTLRDLCIKDSASWGVHFVTCDGVHVDGVRVDNRARPNGDGLDLESSRNVFISNCHIDCDDDAICLKSSIAERPVENVVVTNCVISSNCAAFKFGTPSRAGFRNVAISNCAVYECGMGVIKLEVVDGGILENVVISNVTMHNVEGPLFVRLGNRGSRFKRPSATDVQSEDEPIPVGKLRNVLISNVRATVRNVKVTDPMQRVDVPGQAMLGILISGIPGHPVEGVTLSDVHITFPGGGTLDQAVIEVPEDETMYPERFFFGVLPAYGAYVRHAKDITFHNVRFDLAERDLRPALVCDDVVGLELDAFRAMGDSEAVATVRLCNSRDVFIYKSRSINDAKAFMVKV